MATVSLFTRLHVASASTALVVTECKASHFDMHLAYLQQQGSNAATMPCMNHCHKVSGFTLAANGNGRKRCLLCL